MLGFLQVFCVVSLFIFVIALIVSFIFKSKGGK